MVEEVQGASPLSSSLHLLSLPPELILEILAYLPLAAHLIFRLQVCRALRINSHDAHASQSTSSSTSTSSTITSCVNVNGDVAHTKNTSRITSLNLGPLKLTPPHRFSLSQWLAARQELQRLRLARPDEDDEETHVDPADTEVDQSSGIQATLPPDLEAHRAGLTLQHAAFDWHKGAAAAPFADTTLLPRPVAGRLRPRVAPRRHKVGVRERRDAGPAHEARMLRRILGFLTLVSPAEALPPEWTLPAWEAGMVEEARRQKLANAPRLPVGLAPWSGPVRDKKEHAATRRETSRMALSSDNASRSGVGALRTLSLIGWSGISGEEVVSLLRTCPALGHVRVVLKTDRLDNGSWEHVRSSPRGVLQGAAPSTHARVVRPPPPVPNEVVAAEDTAVDPAPQPPVPFPSSSFTSFTSYLETQVVVNVGSRVPPGANVQIKGQGLSAGYRALCFSPSSSTSSPCPPYAEQASSAEQRIEGGAAAPLHVIFQGRFRLPDAIEIEEMLAWSEVRCSTCRAVLLF